MRFRDPSAPPYFNKSDQFRMLRMVGALMLVVVGMKFAADPKMWTWLVPQAPNKAEQKSQPQKDIDYGVKFEEDSPLAPDAFRSRAEGRATPKTPPAIAEASPQRATTTVLENPTTLGDYVIEIDPALLATVSDGWLGIRKNEAPAFYAIIAKAKDSPLKLLETVGDNRVDYSVLMTDSDQFRGKLLTVEGTIRLIETIPIAREDLKADYGFERYYIAWMWTESSGNSPYKLVCTSLPEDMPAGQNIEHPAKFTGYFFKKEGYQTEQGFHVAPLLIGKHIRWNRPRLASAPPLPDHGLTPYVIGLAVIIAVGLGLMIWRFNVSDKKFGHQHIDHFTSATPAAIKELENLEPHDPNELFRQLEAEAKAADSDEPN